MSECALDDVTLGDGADFARAATMRFGPELIDELEEALARHFELGDDRLLHFY